MKPSKSHFHDIHGMRLHVRTWGNPSAPRFFLMHGWMDVSGSFQFVVDCLKRGWYVVAPDWRGFGFSARQHRSYWFPDYYGDLDALLDIYSPGQRALLVGHSMGGFISLNYAGIRPERVARVISMEGFGLSRTKAEDAPRRVAKWLEQIKAPPTFRPYDSFDALAARLRKDNQRLSPERAIFLAQQWGASNDSGEVVMLNDPAHKITNPILYRHEEILAGWNKVLAPVLWVYGSDKTGANWHRDTPEQLAERKGAFRDFHEAHITDSGHMMHLDQPEQLARVIEDFIDSDPEAAPSAST